MFSQKVRLMLNSYVYIYIDPRNGVPFYIGQGKGNRVFGHDKDSKEESRKIRMLKELGKLAIKPKIDILRHGLSSEEAKLVESVCIDLLGIDNLTNELKGKYSRQFGRAGVEKLIQRYDAPPVDVTEKCIAININQSYKPDMTERQLYECVRGRWPLGSDREKADYALAVYHEVILESYKIAGWFEAGSVFSEMNLGEGDRFEFVGNIDSKTSKKYKGKSLPGLFEKGAQFPVRYLNIKDA